jgi:hypothetical protein
MVSEPLELDDDPVDTVVAPAVPPDDEEELPDDPEDVFVPAETSEPTEIGSAVTTPSIGAVTTVSLVSASASS